MNWDVVYPQLTRRSPFFYEGKVVSNNGQSVTVRLPHAVMGSSVKLTTEKGKTYRGEVVAFEGEFCIIMPYEEISFLNAHTRVELVDDDRCLEVSEKMLGRVVDSFGRPIDGQGAIEDCEKRGFKQKGVNPLDRPSINTTLDTGIRAINSFMTLGKGQRLGIMAGSGVGKSVLMGMIARNTSADVNVIALVGERGREVLDFIESDLGEEGLKRSVVVVATSDESPLKKMKAAYAATTIAEFFRDQGQDVLLMMDSVTRFAMAAREIGMTTGEPPGPKGYGPSVFSKLPKLLERAGTSRGKGAITGIYTVLVEGDDLDEPISDAVRSITDGHLVLSRELAGKNHYPAIDVLDSISRVMPKVVTKEHKIISSYLRDLMGAYRDSEDLINVGAYAEGTNERVDKAIRVIEQLNELLKQDVSESTSIEETYDLMVEIARKAEGEFEGNGASE